MRRTVVASGCRPTCLYLCRLQSLAMPSIDDTRRGSRAPAQNVLQRSTQNSSCLINIHHTCTTQVVLSISTTLAQHCARQVCLLALELTSAPLVHPHLMAARHAAPAGGNVIHLIFHCALATSQVHPKSAGLGYCGALIVVWPHTFMTCLVPYSQHMMG